MRPLADAGESALAVPAEVARWDADARRLEIGAPGARIAVLRSLRAGADVRTIEGAGHWVAYEAAEAFNAMANEMLG